MKNNEGFCYGLTSKLQIKKEKKRFAMYGLTAKMQIKKRKTFCYGLPAKIKIKKERCCFGLTAKMAHVTPPILSWDIYVAIHRYQCVQCRVNLF